MPPQVQDITADIDEILEIDVADIDSILAQSDTIDTSIPGIEDDIISKTKTDDILQRIEERKTPDFLDNFSRTIGSILNIQKPPIAQIGVKQQVRDALDSGDIERIKDIAKIEGTLDQIKQVYSIDQGRNFWEELGTSFITNLLPDYIDHTGDEITSRIQEEVNAILQSEGLDPVQFNNDLTPTQNLGKAIGNTAAMLPYYYVGGALTAPTRAAALARIVQINNPLARGALNAIQNIGHTMAAFSAAEVLHSGYDPKNIMINGVLQGSGEAIAEMALYPVLSKVLGKTAAKYWARYLATSTTEFFQELTGQYFATGEFPDVETIGITAIVSGLFGIAARHGMEVDILNVYNNAVKERERLLNKRKQNPDSFTEEDLKVLNESNNLAEAIKNNAANWRLKDQFKQFVADRKKKRGDSFQKANQRLQSLSKVAGVLSTEVDIEGLTKSPENLIGYLESRGFTEQEIVNTPPEDILADPRIITEADQQNLIDNYYEIFQGLSDLQEELTNPEQLLTQEELFGDGSQRELGITETEAPAPEITKEEILPTKEEIPEITDAELPEVETTKKEIEPESETKVEEPTKKPVVEREPTKETTKKLGQEIVDSPERDKTTAAVKWGLTLTDKQAEEVRAEIKRGTDQFIEDIKAGKEIVPNEQVRLQSLREALSAKTGKSIEYTTEGGFTEVPLEKNKILSNVVKKVKGEEPTKVETKKPVKTLAMNFDFGKSGALGKGSGVQSSNTFDAIIEGKRTATSRRDSSLDNVNVGDRLRFTKTGRSGFIEVEVTAKRKAGDITPEQWAKLEGYNAEGAKANWTSGKNLSQYTQIEYKVISKPEVEKPKTRKAEFPLEGERGGFAPSTGEAFVDETIPGLISVSDLKKHTNDKGFLDQYTIKTAEGIAEHEKAHAITEVIFQARDLHPSVKNRYGIPSSDIPQQRYIRFLDDFDSTFEKIRDENERLRKENKRDQTIPLVTDFLKGEKYQLTNPAGEELTNQIALWKKFPDLHKEVFPEFNKILSNNSDIISEVAKAIGQVSVVRKRKAKLSSGEVVDIIEQPTLEDIGLNQPTRADIDETITTSDLPTESLSPVDIPQSDLTQAEITSKDLPTADVRDIETNTDNSSADNTKETDGRDEHNVEENTAGPEKNGLIVTRIVNQEDVKDSLTLSGWLAARGIAIMSADIDLAAINSNQDFPTFVKTLVGIIGKDKFKSLNPKESTFRRVWFKSKDKITKNNFIAEDGKGITLNTSRSPGEDFINRIDNASQMDLMVNDYNNQNPDDKINLYYFDGYYTKDKSKRTGKDYYKTLSNAIKSVKEKQKEFLKSRFIFYSTASDGKKEVWIQASQNIWGRFSNKEDATKFYNDRKSKYNLPDLTETDNTQFLATRLYYFEKMDGILKTGLTDANFTKRAQIYMSAGGHLNGQQFNAEFVEETDFYDFDPNTHEITRSNKGEKEAHDGAIYLTLDKMKEVMGYMGEGDKRIFKPFFYTVDKNGRPIGLKCACFVAPPSMEAEMKKAGVDTRVYLSAEKMGQVKGGEKIVLDGKNMVVNATEVEEHSEATFTRAIFPTLPVDHNNLRPTDVFNNFVKKRISQFTDLVQQILGNADTANQFLRKQVKYTGDSKYENVGRMLEMGFSWHPEVVNVVKDIFKNKYINDNLMKFKRKGSTAYLAPDHNGTVKVGEVLLPEYFSTKLEVKPGDKVVVNRSPSARVDNFRVLTVKGFHSKSRHGNAITMNGGETIFYQESDYDIDKVHVVTDMTKDEIAVLESLQKAVGVVPVEKSKKVDNVWDVNQQWAVQDRFSAGKLAIGEITNIQTVYSMLVQNRKALQVSPKGEVVVVDLNYAIQNGNKDNFYLVPKFQDEIEMQKFIAPIHQASVDNAKLDALSTIMNGEPYTRYGLISSLFNVVEPNFKVKSKLGDKFDPIQIGFNSNSSPMKQMLNVMKTFTKDWDDGGSSWSYDDQHNAIMAYKNSTQNRTDEAGETLFPNSPLHNFFMGYPRASLTNGGYFGPNGNFIFRDHLRMHHYEAMESAFRKDIDRLDPYKGGKVSPERNEQMTNVIIEIFNLKEQHYKGEIPTTDRVEVTSNGTLNQLEGYHTKVKRLIENLKLNADEKLWFDLKMLNNFDGIQSKGKFKGNLSPEQLKEVLLRDYNTRNEFMTKGEGKNYKQFNLSAYQYPRSREEAFKSRYEPYFVSIAISDETLKKYANTYNNFYNQNIKKKQEISSGFLAESKGSLGVGVDPSRIMDTFSGALKSANKYLNPRGEASWWKWFTEDKHAEITNRQIAKINEKLDKVYGTEVWGEKTVTDFIVHTLTEGTGSRPATRARLDFDQVPITVEEGNILILELESIYRQLNTSKPGKFKQSVFLTKELMYKHPITKKFYDTLNSNFKDVNKYAAELFLDIESIEKGSFKVEEPVTIPLLSVKSPYSTKVTRKRINAYHKLYKKYMELKIKQDMGEVVTESQIELAQKAYESYLERNPDVKDTLDLMRGVATVHQELSEAAIIGSTILKSNPAIKSELTKEGIIPANFKSEKSYWNKVLDYFDKKGIKYSTNIYDPAYDIAKRAEIRRRKAEYEDRWGVKIKMPDEQLFIAIDRMDKAAKEIYDFDKETFDTYIAPRKEELKQQIIFNLTGLKTKSGKEIDAATAEKIANKLLSFIPDNFRRIDRYFPWVNFDFQVERQYSVWNLDSLTDDIKSEALSLDEWLGKPTTTGFFKPRRADWQTALKEGKANIPWDIPEVLRVRMLASMNVRKISAVRGEFANLFKEIRTNILDGKLTPREETFFEGIERYLNILKYDLQSIPWARKALKYGTFNGDYSNNDYLDSTEIKEWQRTFYTNADMWSKIYRNLRTFSFLGLEMPVSVRNVTSQGVVVAGADLGHRRIVKSIYSLLTPGKIHSGSAIVPEKVNGEYVTNDRLMVDLGLAEDDILANVQESNLPTQFSILKDIDKTQFAKLTEKAYKLSGQMANWSLETINIGPGFAKSFFGIPLTFRDSEIYLNRLGTAKAAVQKVWEDFDKRGVSITPEEKYAKALDYARKKVDEIHFDYGLLNRPQMMRHKMGASVFIFRSFTWNQVNMFYNWAREWKQVPNWENTRRLAYFVGLQALGIMAKAYIGIEFLRFLDWSLGDLAKDFWNYLKWLVDDDERALNEIGYGSTKKIRDTLPDIDENTAAAIAATNHVFTGIVPDAVNIWLYTVSDEEFREPWNLSKRNKNLLALYQAGGLKQPIKISKFNDNLSRTIRAMRKGIDPKYPDETMKPGDFIQWYLTRQMLGTYIPYPEYNTKLQPPAGVGLPDFDTIIPKP